MKACHKIAILILVSLFCLPKDGIAQDSLIVKKPVKSVFSAEPMRATMLAIALPGFGQIYNRKYWKVPFVYAGFGAILYFVSFNSREYSTYLKAYQDFTDNIAETQSYIPLIKNAVPSQYDPVLFPESYSASAATWYRGAMLRQVDYYKKYRDLSYIGIAAWYLFTILDANVDASLYNYDISNDLDIKLEPALLPMSGRAVPGLSLKVTF